MFSLCSLTADRGWQQDICSLILDTWHKVIMFNNNNIMVDFVANILFLAYYAHCRHFAKRSLQGGSLGVPRNDHSFRNSSMADARIVQ